MTCCCASPIRDHASHPQAEQIAREAVVIVNLRDTKLDETTIRCRNTQQHRSTLCHLDCATISDLHVDRCACLKLCELLAISADVKRRHRIYTPCCVVATRLHHR